MDTGSLAQFLSEAAALAAALERFVELTERIYPRLRGRFDAMRETHRIEQERLGGQEP